MSYPNSLFPFGAPNTPLSPTAARQATHNPFGTPLSPTQSGSNGAPLTQPYGLEPSYFLASTSQQGGYGLVPPNHFPDFPQVPASPKTLDALTYDCLGNLNYLGSQQQTLPSPAACHLSPEIDLCNFGAQQQLPVNAADHQTVNDHDDAIQHIIASLSNLSPDQEIFNTLSTAFQKLSSNNPQLSKKEFKFIADNTSYHPLLTIKNGSLDPHHIDYLDRALNILNSLVIRFQTQSDTHILKAISYFYLRESLRAIILTATDENHARHQYFSLLDAVEKSDLRKHGLDLYNRKNDLDSNFKELRNMIYTLQKSYAHLKKSVPIALMQEYFLDDTNPY